MESIAKEQEALFSVLVGLVRACSNNPKTEQTDSVILQALLESTCGEIAVLQAAQARVQAEKNTVAPDCAVCMNPCGNTDNYDFARLYAADPAIRRAKRLLMAGMQALAREAAACGQTGSAAAFFHRGLYVLAEDWDESDLLPIVLEAGEQLDALYKR